MGLNSNQKVVGYSCKIPAAIVPVCMSYKASCYCSLQDLQHGKIDDYSMHKLAQTQVRTLAWAGYVDKKH